MEFEIGSKDVFGDKDCLRHIRHADTKSKIKYISMEISIPSRFPDLANNDQHKVIFTIIMTVGWFWLYSIVHFTYQSTQLKSKTLLDTRNRIVSIIHGVGSFTLACVAFPSNNFKYDRKYILVNSIVNWSISSAYSHSPMLCMTLLLVFIMDFGMQDLSFITLFAY